jgi:alginate O-acetyltransferase complex protein AlgI
VLFCSYAFLAFFVAVYAVYWSLPWRQARVALLVVASFVFYASWNHWLALLVFASTAADYLIGLALDRLSSPRGRYLLAAGSVVMNLGVLGYFKYANFFLQSLAAALHAVGGTAALPVLNILAPIGVSFYTFEAINYVVDVYRRKIPAERNLAHFLLFITFFPHLLAGPIVRARDFLPQVRRPKRWSGPRLHLGARYVLMGLFKKMVIADHMALFADPVFARPGAYGAGTLWLAALAYALQVYGDFSGYSDMAIGTAHMLGYKLAPNFAMPFLAPNMAEFWRRWHISLSSWIRDYVYIPLGGSRRGRLRTGLNLMAAMVLSGLWHGASWPCVAFGFIHGVYLLAHRGFRAVCGRLPRLDGLLTTRAGTLGRIALTFACFLCSLAVFRCATIGDGAAMVGRMLCGAGGLPPPVNPLPVWHAFAALAFCHWLAASGLWERLNRRLPSPVRGLGYACALALVLVLAPVTTRTFVYFHF